LTSISPCLTTIDHSPTSSFKDRSPIDGAEFRNLPMEYDSSESTPLSGTLFQKDRENESAVELSLTGRGSTITVATVN